MKGRVLYACFLIALFALYTVSMMPPRAYGSATIWTDKPDYSPGDTVIISGSGFLGNAQVRVTVTRPDSALDTIYASTDETGAFTCNYPLDGITGTYTVTATDSTNTAATTFTDTQKDFTATISPTTANPSQIQTYTITITNHPSNPPGNKLGSAKVDIPFGFTSVSITIVTASAGKSWTATVVSGQIKLTAADTSNRLDPGQSVSVSFSATAPATTGTYTWTTTAYTNPSWSGDVFHLVGSQPKVTVTAPTYRYFTATISPTTCLTGETESYTITITNDMSSSSGVTLGSAKVTIPSGFTAVTVTSVTASAGKDWTAGVASGKINLDADHSWDELSRGQYVSVTFSATAPGTPGTREWTTEAYGCEEVFTIIPPQPTVTVSAPTTVSITITSSPVTGSGFVKVDNVAITTATIFTWTPASSHKLEALSPVPGLIGVQYVWTSWSDGGLQTHFYTVPGASATVTANYQTQYSVIFTVTGMDATATGTVATINGVAKDYSDLAFAYSFWANSGDIVTYDYESIVASTTIGKQFRLDSVTGPASPITVTFPVTIIGHYVTQYYLTVVSPYDTPGGEGWYDDGDTAYTTLVYGTENLGAGTQAVFTGWSGDASGTDLTSDPIDMDGPKTAIADWQIQYHLDVVTDPSTLPPIPGADWYDECTWVQLTAPEYVPDEAGVGGVRYRFDYWDVDGASQGTGVNPIDIHMNAPHTATAHYVTQYYLTVQTSPPGVNAPTGEDWYDTGTYASISTAQYEDIVPDSSRYRFDGWTTGDMSEITDPSATSTTVLMDKAKTVTANYVVQYKVTFDQTGVGTDFTDTVVIIDGINYGVAGLPVSFWYDSGSLHSFAFQSPLVVIPDAKQYVWASTTGLSTLQADTITVGVSGSIIGNYKTQYYLTVKTFPHVLVPQPTGFPVNPPSGWYDEGTQVTLTAAPSGQAFGTEYWFTWWVVYASPEHTFRHNPITISMNSPTTATASYCDFIDPEDPLGDVNLDGKVDMTDLVTIARHFGAKNGEPNYNSSFDLDRDGRIGLYDLAAAARNMQA